MMQEEKMHESLHTKANQGGKSGQQSKICHNVLAQQEHKTSKVSHACGNMINNRPVTVEHVDRAKDAFDPDASCLKRKGPHEEFCVV